jgi:two-component system sensor histidine kinase VicK
MNILKKKHQSIEFIVKGNIENISIDVEEMGKVINNLIINASEQSLENSKIIIQIENNKENVNVSFINYGYSKINENPNDIFEEYLTCANRFRKVGFGLEFYNCKKIIEAHNGNIFAKTIENKGTSITFSLPI